MSATGVEPLHKWQHLVPRGRGELLADGFAGFMVGGCLGAASGAIPFLGTSTPASEKTLSKLLLNIRKPALILACGFAAVQMTIFEPGMKFGQWQNDLGRFLSGQPAARKEE
eukprot:TRINITY_DN44457_c0_g1_i1.p1 TRINITY_DN44457_c0_g1~~TRINITY_DN44457_c0_g1_i1.p1  ORF type:complete len:112 (-),score=21.48 TRINITY_DN44457_c0_g1_i1:117-452(-)